MYIMTNKRNGILYIGVTNGLYKRIWQHKNGMVAGFTKKYNVHLLVYYELHDDINSAILREKQIKKWNRSWKIRMIEEFNSEWNNLYNGIL